MIGGGPGSMIGPIHRHAALLDGQYELIGGAFSRDFKKSKGLGEELGLDVNRVYPSYNEMLVTEKNYPADQRIEVISIVTPNDLHFEMAKAALLSGFHIIIDKPLTQFVHQANELMDIAEKVKKLVCITYVYSGYPMIKEARPLIRKKKLGKINKVIIEYTQGWLSSLVEGKRTKNLWRMDPTRSFSGTMADNGTHAFHLAEYVTGLKVTRIRADICATIPNRLLEDDGTILLKLDHHVHGLLIASQAAAGEENRINLHVYAEQGSLHWQHDDPSSLFIKWQDQPTQILRAGTNNHYLDPQTLRNCRAPAGHPEGYIEAFANIYRNFVFSIRAIAINSAYAASLNDYPKIEDGARGVAFVETVIAANKSNKKWIALLD